jgi:hypothetical protein
MSALRIFIPITKVNAARRLIYGVATAEVKDRAGEICDYASTKPFYEKWSQEIAKSSGGKSLGNLRAMHGAVAAGKITAIAFNDDAKQIEICAKVVDDVEWAKVQEGVYTGFSQGGVYERRWTDASGSIRYTAAPNEISLVDLPCLPEATFEMIKADGSSERRPFAKGPNNAARLAQIAQELEWLHNASTLEDLTEQDNSTGLDELRDLIGRLYVTLRAVVNKDPPETTPDRKPAAPLKMLAAPTNDPCRNPDILLKAGARHSKSDSALIQHLHDTSVELGASCEAQKIAQGPLEKRFDILTETLADLLNRVKNIEQQPLPLPFPGQPRAISKAEDSGIDDPNGSAMDKLLSDPHALSLLAIKLAQRNGRSPLR